MADQYSVFNPTVDLNPYATQIAEIQRRKRLAELLQQQGSEPLESQVVGGRVIPISPWQILAKGLQTGMGAYQGSKADKAAAELQDRMAEEQRTREAEVTAAERGIAGRMFGQRDQYTNEGMPVAAGPTVKEAPTSGDKLGEITPTAQYKYDPQSAFQMAMTPAGREAMKGNPMLAAALANMVKPKEPEEFYAPTETADGLVQFGKLGGKKVTGVNAAPKSETLPTDYRLWQLSGSKLPFDQWDQQRRRAGAATTTVNTGNTYGSTVAQSLGKSDSALVDAARAAPTQIENATRIKNLLEQNPITGTGAEARLSLDRALSTAGLIDKNRTRATETLVSALAGSTLEAVKTSGLGAGQGFTDKDREFLERARSGNIEINAGTLRDLADLQEKAARLSIEKGNAVLRRWKKSGSFGPEFDLEEVAMPPVGGGLPPGATRDKP